MEKQSHDNWSLYIIENKLGHWYTGITNNVEKRFLAHQVGKGAKALRGKGPLTLIMSISVGSRSDAAKLEYALKQLSKAKKRAWVNAHQHQTTLDLSAQS